MPTTSQALTGSAQCHRAGGDLGARCGIHGRYGPGGRRREGTCGGRADGAAIAAEVKRRLSA